MGLRFREIEKIVLRDGWYKISSRGSHNQYKHPSKPGKVTIPNHSGDIDKFIAESIFKQAGITR
jgi:predicted RNA binding protein YcfA (HicA-like mRNA interferase family)